MKLDTLAELSETLSTTRSRSAKIRLLSAHLRELEDGERETAVGWLAGTLPGGRLGLGPAAIQQLRALQPASAPALSIKAARQQLDSLREVAGKGSMARKQEILARLFGQASGREQRFLARLLLGELRQGALEGVMAEAIAEAAGVALADVRRALMLSGQMPPVAEAALSAGPAGLSCFKLELFRPLNPMLASPTLDLGSALASLDMAVLDYKIDGARAQIHKREGDVKIYSRSGKDLSSSLPEVISSVKALPVRSLILDGEVIALNESGRPHPFQHTMRRFGRKLGVAELQAEMPLSLFCFDCLHADGKDLIDQPLERRLQQLAQHVPEHLIVPRLLTRDVREAEHFLRQALQAGHEGVMAKSLTAPYEAGSRGASWLKIKVAHTLDLVVLAAEWGSGRRTGWLSNLHLGARSDEGFVMLGKTFKGLTDDMLAWQTEQLQALALQPSDTSNIVRVRPELVVEIAFNDLQVSSRYPGGLALRFARVLRYRQDKTVADADTMDTVRTLARLGKSAPSPA